MKERQTKLGDHGIDSGPYTRCPICNDHYIALGAHIERMHDHTFKTFLEEQHEKNKK